MIEAAKTHMLGGFEPESERDWMLVANFVAANIQTDIADVATKLVLRLFDCPLSNDDIEQVVAFQIMSAQVEFGDDPPTEH